MQNVTESYASFQKIGSLTAALYVVFFVGDKTHLYNFVFVAATVTVIIYRSNYPAVSSCFMIKSYPSIYILKYILSYYRLLSLYSVMILSGHYIDFLKLCVYIDSIICEIHSEW